MKTIDISAYIVGYNFVIGILVMLSSQKLGTYAAHVNKAHGAQIARYTSLSTFSFGACVTALSAFIYIAFHVLRIGV
ncbi:MAG TPA: hypothetical protein VHQ01_00965 [Pyrinomonadaceae bacterium]|nr:hypothetical protein [Pyrinomonadaceae bacterium]